MTDIDRLIDAVEAGKMVTVDLLPDSMVANWQDITLAANAKDLNAAKRLHDALLPDRYLDLSSEHGKWKAFVAVNRMGQIGESPDNPARAWLLAVLKAYRSTT